MASKHEAVQDALLELIQEQEVGSAIPAERQLAAQLGVSRMTLRQVIASLVSEGYLVSRQGSGTFVAQPKISQPLTMTSFSEDMRRRGFTPASRTLSLQTVDAGPRVGRRLEVSPRTPVLCARRLRLADDEPMAIETLHVPAERVPGMSARDLEERSFYDLLRDVHGIQIRDGLQTVEPTVLSEEEAEVLAAPVYAPAFLFERITRDTQGRVIEYVRSLYRGDRYRLVSDLRPPEIRAVRSRT